MNSLANLNAVVDVQGDSSTWPSDQGWDPPVATICTGSLTDNRLHFHHSAALRQEWDWSDSHMLLASQYATDEHENLDCKPSILQVEALGSAGAGVSGSGLRQYSAGILSAANMSPSIGGGAAQSSWPGLLNAVPLRQHMGLESSTGSCYSSPSLMYGGGATGLGSGGSGAGLSSYYTHHTPLLGLASEIDHQRRMHDILKRGMYSAIAEGGSPDFMSGRLGLNLGGRTYFSANDNNMLARFHVPGKRFRPNSPSLHVPLCQADGCKADLSIAKHYHRRHKVCEYHSKAATVIITSNTQRFCQQCSRFHALTEFDEGKRSCRKRLADHNRRRRKPPPGASSLPAPNSGTPSNLQPTSSTDNPASNQNEDQDVRAGAAKSQSDQPGAQQVPTEGAAASTSSGELTIVKSSVLSPMTLAPSVSLTLQNGSRENQSNPSSMKVSSEVNNIKKKDTAYENQAAPFLLNGPSLSLSSNIAAAAGAQIRGDYVATSDHPSPTHAPHSFNEVELSVPWLRNHAGSSSRINLMQKCLGKLTAANHQEQEGSMVYNTTSSCRRHGNDQQFINEHGHMFAEHMHNLQSPAGSVSACDDQHHHHHQGSKTENWMLENAVAQEGQIVLSLLETASSKKENNYNNHQSAFNAREQAQERHPLGFLQHQHHAGAGLHLNSASPSDIDHEASDAALSLHCMQVLRPLNESLYTTADFMKDGFV